MEDEHKFDLGFSHRQIKAWSSWYFKKNSKKRALILLRAYSPGLEQIFWKNYIELHVAGKILSKIRITPEAFDSLSRNPDLKRSHYSEVEIIVLKQIN